MRSAGNKGVVTYPSVGHQRQAFVRFVLTTECLAFHTLGRRSSLFVSNNPSLPEPSVCCSEGTDRVTSPQYQACEDGIPAKPHLEFQF